MLCIASMYFLVGLVERNVGNMLVFYVRLNIDDADYRQRAYWRGKLWWFRNSECSSRCVYRNFNSKKCWSARQFQMASKFNGFLPLMNHLLNFGVLYLLWLHCVYGLLDGCFDRKIDELPTIVPEHEIDSIWTAQERLQDGWQVSCYWFQFHWNSFDVTRRLESRGLSGLSQRESSSR